MKIFQIIDNLCWWDATPTVHTIEQAHEMFAPDCVFVEAPDYVFEGWGYDEHETGDDRFIRPEVPEGYEYDPRTGTFYELESRAKSVSPEEQLSDLVKRMTELLKEAETVLETISKKGEER